jgi:hypothetical protein
MGPNAWRGVEPGGSYLMINRKLIGIRPEIAHDVVAIGWDGFNGRGTFCVDETKFSRIETFLNPDTDIRPWNKLGRHLVLCEQSNIGRATNFKNLEEYYQYVMQRAPSEVKFRKKPIGEDAISFDRLVADLADARAIISLNSTVSIDAMCAGYSAITLDIGDPTYPITSHNLDRVFYPNRLPLFEYMAHCQYHYTEIENGDFWSQLYPKRGPKLHEFIML